MALCAFIWLNKGWQKFLHATLQLIPFKLKAFTTKTAVSPSLPLTVLFSCVSTVYGNHCQY